MPSNNKRKHHGFSTHSSNGELPLTSSADNRQDVIANGELSDRKHLANGKENLLSEVLPDTRASSKASPADNPPHCDIRARTASDGVPAENSCLAQTSEKCMNGHRGLHHGVVIAKCTNGKNKPDLCSSPTCSHRQNGGAQAIANLKHLNKQLLEQVCSLRSEDSMLREKLKSVEIQLEQNSTREDVLIVEKTLLEEQKIKFELDLKATAEELAKLSHEKLGLLEAKETLCVAYHDLQHTVSECEVKLLETNEKLKASIDALALAEEKRQLLESEMELLRLEQNRLNEEIMLLHRQNSDLHCVMKVVQTEKECLENELKSMQSTLASAGEQVTETLTIKEALENKLDGRSLQREGFQMQLEGAWQQIQSLEAQQEASIAERFDLEKQIKQLENALVAARDECEESFCMLELEREEKLCLRTTLGKVERMGEALQNEFDAMTVSTANLQMSADHSQQQIISLQSKVDTLLKEGATLERTKASLKDKLERLKVCSDEAFVSSKQEIDLFKEKVHKLEEALALANKQALEEGKCARVLISEIKELSTSVKQRKRLADVSVSLAAMSTGSLLVLGIMFLIKRKKF
ncbi:hypothetical protein GOP47_0017156 [Adiantum capillus-veneris]|uniref:Uncharacterized protein n=1 Tax=Adiantum capillus-veneris TaxID=13818 RepID=A0A9D4UJ25_ADICA|nr:hypothetical protein GOP47_0017156 [Adiantum capillus-veneris]